MWRTSLPPPPSQPQTCCRLSILPLVATCQQVATGLSRSGLLQLVISRLVTTCHFQTCYNLLKHVATSLLINLQQVCLQLATSLLTTYNRLVVTSCRKPCERILISACCNKLLQDVNRLVTTCPFLAVLTAPLNKI